MENIVNKIIEKIKEIKDLQVIYEPLQAISSIDGELKIIYKESAYKFNVEFKRNFRLIHLNQLEINNRNFKNVIIFSDYIGLTLRNELKNKGISYADAIGNVFIKSRTLYIYIDAKKDNNTSNIRRSNSFGSVGLKFIFYILIDEWLINKSYREISNITHLSLDTISRTLRELENQGFIIKINNKYKKLQRTVNLFEKWVTLYEEILKPKITRGLYRSLDKNFNLSWRNTYIDYEKTKWGGEPAGDIVTNYLQPEFFTIYSKESDNDLLKKYKFISDINGNIEIINKFWSGNIDFNYKINNPQTVHPFLIYADLVYTNNSRNNETAKLIYKEYINGIISETR